MKTRTINTPKDWQSLKYHPLSELTDFGAGIDLEGLAEHMRRHGYDHDERIILLGGEIFDGRHRHKAAIAAGVTPTFAEFVGDDPLAYVLKKIHRQHLSDSQRGMLAAKLATLPVGRPKEDNESAEIIPSIDGITVSEAAGQLNVGTSTVERARKVVESGTEKLQDAVKSGDISVSDAAKVSAQPPQVQDAAVDNVRAGKTATASAFVGLCERCRRIGVPSCEACREKQQRRTKAETNGTHVSTPPPTAETKPPKPETIPAKEKTVAEIFAGLERVLGQWRDVLGADRVQKADELVNAAFQEITLLQGALTTMTPGQTQQALFNNFWAAYPKKTQKEDALKAWKKLSPAPELVAKMIAAIKAQEQTEQWQRKGGQFIPYPATWLNGKRWEDELPEAAKPKTQKELIEEGIRMAKEQKAARDANKL